MIDDNYLQKEEVDTKKIVLSEDEIMDFYRKNMEKPRLRMIMDCRLCDTEVRYEYSTREDLNRVVGEHMIKLHGYGGKE